MANKPSKEIIQFAANDVNLPSTNKPNKEEPSHFLQTTGFDDDQVVTAENLNYVFNNFSSWLNYLSSNSDGLEPRVKALEEETESIESTKFIAGDGLTGSGGLKGEVITTLGTPSSLDGSTDNSVSTQSHKHKLNMANESEAKAGTNPDKLMSALTVHQAVPSTFSPSNVNGSTNSVVLPNGLIMKFGTLSASELYVFPTPFPNGTLSLTVSVNSSSASEIEGWYQDYTVSGFKFNSKGKEGSYIAIGY